MLQQAIRKILAFLYSKSTELKQFLKKKLIQFIVLFYQNSIQCFTSKSKLGQTIVVLFMSSCKIQKHVFQKYQFLAEFEGYKKYD